MQCKRCGGAMMPETVIKLQRSVFGWRETRSQGAYCASCGIGCPVDSVLAAAPPSAAIFARLRSRITDFRRARRLSGAARPGSARVGGIAAYDPLSLAR
jgi:hypothetical protein